jgi:D-alanyl-D-alanine carboxypeptidase/D-alanyl-D-alanine-endopeptidase (penicillin-binding protein 4)
VPTEDAEHVPAAGPPSRRRRVGRWVRRATAVLVLLVLVAAGVSHQLDLGRRWLGLPEPSPVTEPALVPPPAGLVLPRSAEVAPVARTTSTTTAVSGAAVRRALATLVRSRKLGPHVVVQVARLTDGTVVHRHGTGPVIPASTLKLLTAVAVLEVLGPDHRFATSVVATRPGRVVLVGGGDPLLARERQPPGTYPARADLSTLARRTARALTAAGRNRIRVGFDTSLFRGPAVNPTWEPSYVPDDVVSPISPLWVDEGRARSGFSDRSPDPARAAAAVFVRGLVRYGVTVVGPLTRAVAPPASAGGRTLAQVRSAPLDELVQHMLEVSDNEAAEVLARQVAVARGQPASFVGAARAVREVLGSLRVPTGGARMHDGSGLSRANRLQPATLLAAVRAASDESNPALRSAVANLPVAGFTGSLATRFQTGDPVGLGTVRAKTGTLTGVHGLAGTVTTRDGAVVAFVAVADRVGEESNLDARVLVDEVAAALAGCRCTR